MKALIFLIVIVFFASSCGYQFYYPKPQEPVLLTHASQLNFNTISTASTLNGLTAVSVAYSPLKNFGVQSGVGLGGGNTTKADATGIQNVTRREIFFIPSIGAGYYKLLKDDFLFELYGGIGLYIYKNKASAFVNKLQHLNLYLQPSLAYVNRNFNVALTTRLDYLSRYNSTLTNSLRPTGSSVESYKFLDYNDYLFFSPGITFKAGSKRLKGQFQLAYSFPLDERYNSIYGSVGDRHYAKFGIGFTFDIDVKRKIKH